VTTPDPRRQPTDDELIRILGVALDEEEPLPLGAVEFAAGTLAWRDMEGELAELLHDSVLEETVMLRDETCLRLLVFQAGDITLDVEQEPHKLIGAISPPGRYRVEVHDGQRSAAPAALTDEAGMFELRGEIRGPVRFVVSDPDGQVAILSPWVTL